MNVPRLTTKVTPHPIRGISITPANLADALAESARLTERDRWLLGLLAEHRVLTVDQITRLGFGSATRARHRLLDLHRRGVLARFRRYVRAGSQPWRYTLGLLGEAIHAASTGAPLQRPAKITEKIVRLAESSHLDHLIGANDIFVGLIAHSRQHRGSELAEWWSPRRTAETTGQYVRPDGYGRWHEDDTEIGFFLEHDRGTERLAQLIDKLDRYAAMTQAQVNKPVLFAFTSTNREANFTHHATRAGWPRQLTIATTATDQHTPPTLPVPAHRPTTGHAVAVALTAADRVWLPLGGRTRQRLIQLAHSTVHTSVHSTANSRETRHVTPTRTHPPHRAA